MLYMLYAIYVSWVMVKCIVSCECECNVIMPTGHSLALTGR